MISDPQEVAKAVLRSAIEHLDAAAECLFCDHGQGYDDYGETLPHDVDCPFHGYERTDDVARLEAWAAPLHGTGHSHDADSATGERR